MTESPPFSASLADLAIRAGMVCIAGSGGKTTLMYRLGRMLAARGLGVVCSSTTKIFSPSAEESPLFGVFARMADAPLPPKPFCVTLAASWLDNPAQPAPAAYGAGPSPPPGNPPEILTGSAACPDPSGRGKVRGYEPGAAEAFWRLHRADALLLEADGAAGRPLKAPAPHEPAIPAATGLVIAVLGLAGLGLPLDMNAVWRPEIFAALSGLAPGEAVTPRAAAGVVRHPRGLFQNSPAGCARVLFLNGAETATARAAGIALAQEVLRPPGCPVDGIYMGSARRAEDSACIHPA